VWERFEGRRKDSHALNGLGVLQGERVVKDTAKKSSESVESTIPVPETDTGGQVEKTKGREITLSKELGKMTP
jgi:hypothetical protein